jgi:quercetin dioxygenase-like cupin family protein
MEEAMSTIRVYSNEKLQLRTGAPGAAMWAVALERSMLTYFEFAPGAVLPEHTHEAEQITLVLEGELTLRCGEKSFVLGPGDVVAIPSNVAHAASTGSAPCKAVDAWSPPREDFLR